ncbi:hypothetical protein [Cyanobium sp. CH-040]|uniref:hypothetical protein n=1 Tax=Cyanobium sp. CH-040 TaxID=2823708 RepID=UPI0020CC59C5|nr:hypothetical protein [Cyanobium sp. CH-040]MCP9928317.1 hypothetical protein [Cyanobium sp. CH-040]
MATITRLLGKPPESGNIRFRQTYIRRDGDDRFVMRRPSDFYTSIFAYGGRGKNTVELPFSSSDINYSSLTRAGTATIQLSTPSGEFQSIQVSGIRKIELLDQDLLVNQLYRSTFGTSIPRAPAASRTRWITNGRWDGTTKTGELDTLTGKGSGANNFYLSRANNDAIIQGSRSERVVDTLFFDEYAGEVDVFLRDRGRANIRVNFTATTTGDDDTSTEASRSALFKTKNLERIVLRDAYFERRNNRWRSFDNTPLNPFGGTASLPGAEPPLIPRQPKTIFQPIPDDIFTPIPT